jgi:Winged helix DNA-binding domain
VREIAGAQAQDVYAGPLHFRSRSRSLTAADVKRARTEERSLLRTWLMRMTIHLIPTDDADWWLPLFEPMIERWSRRRLGQLGMPAGSVERALKVIATELDDGPITRPEARERIREAGIELDPQTGQHIVGLAVVSGLAVLGPDRGAQSLLVRREDWLGKAPASGREKALAELARRYLRAFGPATDRDFAYWAGLPLRDVRAGLDAISGEIEEVRVGKEPMLVIRGALPRLPRPGQIRMLGNFDTYLLGWREREFSVSPDHAGYVKEGGGGWIRPVVVRDGVVIGGWRSRRRDGRIEVSLDLPGRQAASVRKAIEAEIADIARFEGMATELVR